MADEWSDYLDELFDPEPKDYADVLFGNASDTDPYALELFGDWMESGFKSEDALQRLDDYMWQEYGIDFSDVFEWQDFQEWYDSQ